jgi:hypothetical protein
VNFEAPHGVPSDDVGKVVFYGVVNICGLGEGNVEDLLLDSRTACWNQEQFAFECWQCVVVEE